jgi:uncharacterized protein YkwD
MLWAPFAILALLAGNPEPSPIPPSSAATAHVTQPTLKPVSKVASGATDDSAAEKEMLGLINKSRAQAGLAALRLEPSLSVAARAHAELMVSAGQLEHRLPGEPALLDRIAEVITIQLDRAGENIAEDGCIEHAHDALMHSPPHRHNLLDGGFNVVGLAAMWSKGRLYVVQDFGHEIHPRTQAEVRKMVNEAVRDARHEAGLGPIAAYQASKLDEAVCRMTQEGRPSARLLQTSYDNRRIITYTQSRPEILPQKALSLLREPDVRQFAVGTCYARTPTYPTGIYWVAILLY